MRYYFYNTDALSMGGAYQDRHKLLLEGRFAATGGPWKYGERLARLVPGDVLLMYQNTVGVIAIGRVTSGWDKQAHTTPQYYQHAELATQPEPHEYRIPVDWYCDLTASPIPVATLRNVLSVPRAALVLIKRKHAEAEALVQKAGLAGCRGAGFSR